MQLQRQIYKIIKKEKRKKEESIIKKEKKEEPKNTPKEGFPMFSGSHVGDVLRSTGPENLCVN